VKGKAWEIILEKKIPPTLPRSVFTANFRLAIRHDYLQQHLNRNGIKDSLLCPLYSNVTSQLSSQIGHKGWIHLACMQEESLMHIHSMVSRGFVSVGSFISVFTIMVLKHLGQSSKTVFFILCQVDGYLPFSFL
jgi:hypothetical protein